MQINIDMSAIFLIMNFDLPIFSLNFSYQMIQSEKKITFKIQEILELNDTIRNYL